MINVIVASHGPLADALLASSRMVYGELPHVFTVTLSDQAGIEGFKQDFATTLKNAGHNADFQRSRGRCATQQGGGRNEA